MSGYYSYYIEGGANMISAAFPYQKQRRRILGSEMAYVEVGEGDPIVLLHGNPTSSYLWRNVLPHLQLSDEEMAEYRRPFAEPGEGRRPTLTWPREIPIEGEPADVHAIATEYADWMGTSNVPKLFLKAEPGAILANDRLVNLVRGWPALTEKAVSGIHFVQEDSPDAM